MCYEPNNQQAKAERLFNRILSLSFIAFFLLGLYLISSPSHASVQLQRVEVLQSIARPKPAKKMSAVVRAAEGMKIPVEFRFKAGSSGAYQVRITDQNGKTQLGALKTMVIFPLVIEGNLIPDHGELLSVTYGGSQMTVKYSTDRLFRGDFQ